MIMDSGCFYHMCPYKEWFDTYQPYSDRTLLMGNNATSKTIGIRIVKIKLYDGLVRTITNVRHVLLLE